MAGFNQYQALPGHLATFKDGNLNLKAEANPPSTEGILFLGTATDGPVGQPVSVTPDSVNLIFGKTTRSNGIPNGATLIPKFEEAWQAGCRDIRLMRVTGKVASANLVGVSYTETYQAVKQEQLGAGFGNKSTVLVLPNGGVDLSTLKVFANGNELSSIGGDFTIDAGQKRVMSPVLVQSEDATSNPLFYDATDASTSEGVDVTEWPVYEDDGVGGFRQKEDASLNKLYYQVDPALFDTVTVMTAYPVVVVDSYTQAVAEVKASITLAAEACNMEDEISVDYEYDYVDDNNEVQRGAVVDLLTDTNGNPMVALGEDHVYDLDETPKAGLKLYVNGAEITTESIFTVDAVAKKITIHSTNQIKQNDILDVSYAYDYVETITPKLNLESIYGGDVYNDVVVKVDIDATANSATITIKKPDAKKGVTGEPDIVVSSIQFPTLQLLADAINGHPLNNVVTASTDFPEYLTNKLQAKPLTNFSGGRDELNVSKEEMYKRLGGVKDSEGYIVEQGAYQLLENYKVDYVIPLGVHADDQLVGKYDNFAYQLALACAVMSHYNNVTMGMISTSSPKEVTLKAVEDHVRKLESIDNTFYMRDRFGQMITDIEGNRIDLGQFIEIYAGPDVIVMNTRLGQIASNAPAAYAGFVTTLPVQSSPLNKAIPSVGGLRFEYSANQLNRLTQKRYVTLRYKPNGQVGIVDSMTAAHIGSDYTRLTTARIVKDAVNQVREVADPFIGEPNDVANRNALTAAISKRLEKMIEKKALVGFDVRVIATQQMELIGEASIELQLQAPFELRRLTTIVSLSQ